MLPGHPPGEVLASIRDVVADNEIHVSWSFLETTEFPASPLRDDILSILLHVCGVT
jgi:hypothetical protein